MSNAGCNRSNLWQYPYANSFSRSSEEGRLLALHPTVKPLALVADAIMDGSARRDTVLEGFLGNGGRKGPKKAFSATC